MFWIFIPSIYFYIGPCFGVLNNSRRVECAPSIALPRCSSPNVGNLIIAPS